MRKGTIGAAKIGASVALLVAAVIFSMYYVIPALSLVTPGSTQFGQGLQLNMTAMTDMFVTTGNTVYLVANFTCTESTNCTNITGRSSYANFTEIGGGSSVIGVEILGTNLTNIGFSYNATVNTGITNIQSANIIANFTASDGNVSNVWTSALLVNMSTIQGCPPAGQPLPPQIPLLNGTMVNVGNCWTNCTGNERAVPYNSTHYQICGPTFGGDTTNFTAIAESGNFSNVPLVIDLPGKAKINFTSGINFSSQQYVQAVMQFAMQNLMTGGRVGINDTEWSGEGGKPNLNITARLTLYNVSAGLGITGQPQIIKTTYGANLSSGSTCPANVCTNLVWDGENLTFTVSGFSDYGLSDAINITLGSPTNYSYAKNSTVFNNRTINLTFTPTWSTVSMKNCTVFGNFTNADWAINNSNVTPLVNNTVNGIPVAINADGPYRWNVYCYDTLNTFDYYYNNWSVIFDSTNPVLKSPTPANASFIYGTSAQLFQINVTETNLDSSKNVTLNYKISDPTVTIWRQKTLVCYNSTGLANANSGPFICNTTIDMPAAPNFYTEGNIIQYYFNTTDLAGNTGNNGTASGFNNVTLDQTKPTPIVSTTNDTDNIIAKGAGINLSVRWTDNYALYNATLETNETGTPINWTDAHGSPFTLSGAADWSNFTWVNNSITPGTVVAWKVYANDQVQPTRNENVSIEGIFTIDGGVPRYTEGTNVSNLASPQVYNPSNNYGFQINWTDDVGINLVRLRLGRPSTGLYTNYTATLASGNTYTYNFTSQDAFGPVGTYNITWFANDTSDNWNNTATVSYTINQAATLTRLWLDNYEENKSYNVGDSYNFTASINVIGKTVGIDSSIAGWVNVTGTNRKENISAVPMTPGTYTVTGYFNGDANYTASSQPYYAIVSGWMNTTVSVNDTYVKAGDVIDVGCLLRDSNSSSALEGYYVEIYNSTTNLTAGRTDSNGIFNYSFTPSVEGLKTLTCAVYNNYTTLYNTSTNGTATYTMDSTAPVLNFPTPTNNSYIKGTSAELFQINVTETNLDSTKNVTLNYKKAGISSFTQATLDCYDAAGTKAMASGPFKCNTTAVDLSGIGDNQIVQYYFNTTDLAGNSGNNGTAAAWLNATIVRGIPQYIANVNSPATFANYSTSANYGFQINWTNGAAGIQAVTFQLGTPSGALTNYTNSTSSPNNIVVKNDSSAGTDTYYINFTQAAFGPSGIYSITWFANDTAGNANTTGTYNYQIYNASNVLNLYLINSTEESANQNITITYGEPVTLNAAATTGTVSLFRNASLSNTATAPAGNATETVTLGAGVWEINASVVSNNANYSDNTTNITYYVTVNKASPNNFLNLQINGTGADSVRAYPNVTNVTGWSNLTGQASVTYNLYRDGALLYTGATSVNTSLLAAANYTFIFNTTGNANYTSGTITRVLNITKGNATITMTALSWNNVYPNATKVTCSISSQGNEVPATLYRNASNANSTDNDISISYLAVGAYSYVCGAGQTENYTASNSSASNLVITKGATTISLMLNSSQASRSYNMNDVANFTANLSVVGKDLTIYSNISAGWVLAGTDSSSQLYNTTVLATKGVYNITANFAGDANYSASNQTYYATVNDVGIPAWTGNATSLANGSAYSTSANYGFQINWADDVAVFNASFQLGRPGGTLTNYTNSLGSTPAVMNISSTYYINFTQNQLGPAGAYNITWFANDTSNNWNKTDTVAYTIVSAATNTTLWINSAATNTSVQKGNNINLTATVNITGTVYIYANLNGWVLLSNSTGTLTNTTSSSGVSPLNFSNITAYFAANENYTASSQHFHINVTADTTAPTIQLFNATSQPFLNASVVKKSNLTFAVNASVSDTGVGVTGQNCTAYVNGTSAGSGTESGGFCNMTVTMPAGGNGNVTLNITINDTNGNLGSNASFVVTMDNTAPNLTIDTPVSGQYLKGTIWVNGTVYDNIAMGTANISINNSAFSVLLFNGNNNTAFNVSNSSYVADGYIALNLGYVDLGGNSGNATIAFYADNTPPSAAAGLTNSSSGTYAPSATQVVQVAVTDAQTNASITLNYTSFTSGVQVWTTKTMTGTPGTTTIYSTTIYTTNPSQVTGWIVRYYIIGTDNATNSISAVNNNVSYPLGNITIDNYCGNNGTALTYCSYKEGWQGLSTGAVNQYHMFKMPLPSAMNSWSSLGGNRTTPKVLESIQSKYIYVYYYNSSAWASYDPSVPWSQNDLKYMNNTNNGDYWINMTSTSTIRIS